MRSRTRWALGIAAVVVLLVIVGIVAVLSLATRERAELLLSGALGRDVTVASMTADWGWTSRFVLADVVIANPAEFDGEFAQVEHLDVALKPLSLIWGAGEIKHIEARGIRMAFVRQSDGAENWDFAAGAEAAAPDERDEFPLLQALLVEGAEVTFADHTTGLDVAGRLALLEGEAGDGGSVAFNGEGALGERAITLSFAGGSLDELWNSDAPYPLAIDLQIGGTRLQAEGSAMDPFAGEAYDLQLALAGPSLAELFPILPVALPDTRPYRIEGHLRLEGDTAVFENYAGQIGESDVAGTLTFDSDGERPRLSGEMISEQLRFSDLAGLIGAEPESEAAASDKALPDEPIAVERLRTADLDIVLKARSVVADPSVPVEAIDARFLLEAGLLTVNPLAMKIAGGELSGQVSLDAREDKPLAGADIDFSGLDLKPFFRDTAFVQQMGGRFSGIANVSGHGTSFADILATMNGEAVVTMRDGSISALLVEAAGLDLAEALGLVIGPDVPVSITCGRVTLHAENGLAEVRRAIIDTTDSTLVSHGEIDFRNQTVDLQVEARAKDFSLIDLNAPVRVSGPLADPGYGIGGFDPLPFFEMGEQQDVSCDALLDLTREAPIPEVEDD